MKARLSNAFKNVLYVSYFIFMFFYVKDLLTDNKIE